MQTGTAIAVELWTNSAIPELSLDLCLISTERRGTEKGSLLNDFVLIAVAHDMTTKCFWCI